MNIVENGFEIVNVDNAQLNKLKQGSFDSGAEKILESLELFIEDLEARYYYDSKIPYEDMFNALKSVVKNAQRSINIRNAIMTGIIQEVPVVKARWEKEEDKESVKQTEEKVRLDVDEVREYAKDKTLTEIAEYFGVPRTYAKNFVIWHKIEYKFAKSGPKALYSIDDIKKLAQSMTVSQIAKMYMVSDDRISKFCKRNGITCKK